MSKSARLVIRLGAEDREWIKSEAERIGADSATLVRMLIRQARNAPAYEEAAAPTGRPSVNHDEPEPLPVEEFEVPADPEPELEQLLAAGPSLLDEAFAVAEAPMRQPAPERTFAAAARPRYQRPRDVPPGAFRAGSMTRAIGVGNGVQGNVIGDGRGNVIRDNYAHFGFVGTRSR